FEGRCSVTSRKSRQVMSLTELPTSTRDAWPRNGSCIASSFWAALLTTMRRRILPTFSGRARHSVLAEEGLRSCRRHCSRGPRVILLAKGVFNPILIDKLYVGVPLMVGVVFEEPYDKEEYAVTVDVGGQTLDLTARAADEVRKTFVTDPFILNAPPPKASQ